MAGDFGLIRYPGSKAKLWKPILEAMPEEVSLSLWSSSGKPWEYREPFFGAGAIGFRVMHALDRKCKVWLNDKDYWICCLWNAVKDCPEELCRMIADFVPTPEAFEEFKSQDGARDIDPTVAGFRKLAMHQMSVSGFGAKSGTCIGGRSQGNAKYTVDCRWNQIRLRKKVRERHEQLTRFVSPVRITCKDFSQLCLGSHERCFVYLDPPYVEKGGALYVHSMETKDHERLAKCVAMLRGPWLLSYDDHELVRRLYEGMEFVDIEVRYSNAVEKRGFRPKNMEVLISQSLQAI